MTQSIRLTIAAYWLDPTYYEHTMNILATIETPVRSQKWRGAYLHLCRHDRLEQQRARLLHRLLKPADRSEPECDLVRIDLFVMSS